MRLSRCFLAVSLLGLGGCAVMNKPISMTDLQPPVRQYVEDQSPDDDYPGLLTGEGNDYSCRYGIHFESKEEYTPPKAQLFADLLAQDLPAITTHKVVLQRFDVYYNYRLKQIHALSGGLLGSPIRLTPGVFFYDKLLIDTNPEVDRYPGMHQVGCDNAHEGEYYPAEISGGYDVVVSWFKFTVDGRPYEFRTFYQYQPQDKAAILTGIGEAIRMSMSGISQRIEFPPDQVAQAR